MNDVQEFAECPVRRISADPPTYTPQDGLGLSLSGGGYRALMNYLILKTGAYFQCVRWIDHGCCPEHELGTTAI